MSSNRYSEPKQTCVFDTECYVNYWSIAFKCVETRRSKRFESFNDSPLDVKGIAKIFKLWRVVGFNSGSYDMPMVGLAMTGARNGELKRASDEIILTNLRSWQFYEQHGINLPDFIDQIDLMDVSPGSPQNNLQSKEWPSLKLYAGRLHSKHIQDLPFEPDKRLTLSDVEELRRYHEHDLNDTLDLYKELKPQIDIRCQISDQYRVDVRSKSDAQIAEAVIRAEIEREIKGKVYKPEIKPGLFNYKPPAWVKFKTPEMRDFLEGLRDAPFVVNAKGVVESPSFLESKQVKIGEALYSVGLGGLHSCESRAVHYSDEQYVLLDRDVTSYYPALILTLGLFPKHLGKAFLKVFLSIFNRRIDAKANGAKLKEKLEALEAYAKGKLAALEEQLSNADETEKAALRKEIRVWEDIAETLKIVLNGSFGKFGSPYSVLSSPHLMIQVTLTGQLAVLMMIEENELSGFQVVSANTDGFVTKVPIRDRAVFEAIVLDWQWDTGLSTEETEYISLHSRDVNNYVAIPKKGKVKLKGAFSTGGPGQKGAMGMKKNPTNEVCIDAVVAYLKDGTPLDDTIYECEDVRRFVTVRRVNGGALDQDGNLVGKVIRFYYARNVEGALVYKTTGNTVPKSEGARPLMTLPDDNECPDDLDREWYVREATAMLQDLGHRVIDPALEGRKGTVLGRMGNQVTYHTVKLPNGVALCGKTPDSIRDVWVEAKSIPAGHRHCAKCRKANEL